MRDSIYVENLKPGTTAWKIVNPARGFTLCPHQNQRPPYFPPEIEGYASLTSVANGETITFHVSTNCYDPAPTTLTIYRLGWYRGLGGREVHSAGTLVAQHQGVPLQNPQTGLVECDWPTTYTLTIPQDWVSGVYVAKLSTVASQPLSRYIVFVVRDDDPARQSHYIYQMPCLTYQAYNYWGSPTDQYGVEGEQYGAMFGRSASLYDHWGPGPWNLDPNHFMCGTGNPAPAKHASEVSFNRPYEWNWYGQGDAHRRSGRGTAFGAGQFFLTESSMVRWLEREGLDVTYVTDIDTHASPTRLNDHKVLLVPGHSEYWSKNMRDQVEARILNGMHVGFFGANLMYWQVRMLPSASGQPNRTVVGYKDLCDPLDDRGALVDPNLRTCLWNDPRLDRAEEKVIGVRYNHYSGTAPVPIGNMTLARADPLVSIVNNHDLFKGTGVTVGTELPNILGLEVDITNANTPAGTTILANSKFPASPVAGQVDTHMTVRTTPSGGVILATGTFFWSHGLDSDTLSNIDVAMWGTRAEDHRVKQITRNFCIKTLTKLQVSRTPAGVVAAGEPVTFTAVCRGGVEPLQYRFTVYNEDTQVWTVLRDYSGETSATWTPTVAAKYHAQVWVRSSGSLCPYDDWANSASFEVVAASALTVTSIQPQIPLALAPHATPVGAVISWTAQAIGGAAPRQFKFWLYNRATQQWSLLQDWGASPTCQWVPTGTQTGDFHVQVWARSANSTADFPPEAWKNSDGFMIAANPPVTVQVVSNQALTQPISVAPHTTLSWKARAFGGSPSAQWEYRIIRQDLTTGVWSILQEYGANSLWSWTPGLSDAGRYNYQVWVRAVGSANAYDGWAATGEVVIR